jgi:hypothetical protein
MPASTNKRRRISEDGESSPLRDASSPRKPTTNVLPSFMTPTKASLAKSYPHLLTKSPARNNRNISPVRQPPRRSIAPEGGLTDVIQPTQSNAPGRSFLDIANDPEDRLLEKDVAPTGMAMATRPNVTAKEVHLSNEEEIERYRTVLMRRVRMLRAECDDLEKQVDQARQATQAMRDAQEKARSDMEATM